MTIKDKNNIPKLANSFDDVLNRVADRVGSYMQNKIQEMIERQYPGWQPLAPATIAAKKGSTKIWFDTGELYNLIEHTVSGGTPKVIKVGIFSHEKAYIAHILEFGNEEHNVKMGGRPLFRLVFDMEKDNIERLILTQLDKELSRFVV